MKKRESITERVCPFCGKLYLMPLVLRDQDLRPICPRCGIPYNEAVVRESLGGKPRAFMNEHPARG